MEAQSFTRRAARGRRRPDRRGFSLVEVMISVGIVALVFVATLSMLTFAHTMDALEQERARAHQIVVEKIEEIDSLLYSYVRADESVTVWDNGTPNNAADDTPGCLTIQAALSDGTVIETPTPVPAEGTPPERVTITITLRWQARGVLGGERLEDPCESVDNPDLEGKVMSESLVTYLVPGG